MLGVGFSPKAAGIGASYGLAAIHLSFSAIESAAWSMTTTTVGSISQTSAWLSSKHLVYMITRDEPGQLRTIPPSVRPF